MPGAWRTCWNLTVRASASTNGDDTSRSIPSSMKPSFGPAGASVHARHAATYGKREADVQRLLDDGVTADLGERWNAVVAASVALTATPSAFGPEHVDRLRRSGLDDLAIADVIHAAAFFNWANRLMLSLGEPAAMSDP